RVLPTALQTATYAVTLLEDIPLFNSGRGAVFTRDGTNELEASVMVSRGYKKRGVGVSGLRCVRNPILLARAVLEHGEKDLGGDNGEHRGPVTPAVAIARRDEKVEDEEGGGGGGGGGDD